jgi:hypothetical protein
MDSKQLVAELHDKGFDRDEAVRILCRAFGVSRSAAFLFVASHPVWAPETTADDSDGWMPALGCYGAAALPTRN